MGKEMQKVNAERKRQKYSKEFKLTAVKLLQAGQKPATQLALELGIRRNLLYQIKGSASHYFYHKKYLKLSTNTACVKLKKQSGLLPYDSN